MLRFRVLCTAAVALACLTANSWAVDLTSLYKLDETSGTSAADATGNHTAGTYENLSGGFGALPSPGDPGGNSVEYLSGANNRRVSINNAGGLTNGADFTITAWVQFNDTTQDHTIAGGPGTFSSGNNLLWWRDESSSGGGSTANNTMAGLVSGDPRGVGATNALNDTQWHLVSLSFGAGSSDAEKLYVDGVRTSSGTPSNETGLLSLTNTLSLGNVGDDHNNQLEGFLDEVGFWDRQLSDGEIAALYFVSDADGNYITDAQGAQILFDFFETGDTGDILQFEGLAYEIVDDVTAFGGTADQSAVVGDDLVLGLNGTQGLVGSLAAVPEPASICMWLILGLLASGFCWRRRQRKSSSC